MDTITIRETIENFCNDNDFTFYDRYSGRGMLGEKCVGIVCNNVTDTMVDLIDFIAENNQISIKQAKKILGNYRSDNMGLKYILYFPTINSLEE